MGFASGFMCLQVCFALLWDTEESVTQWDGASPGEGLDLSLYRRESVCGRNRGPHLRATLMREYGRRNHPSEVWEEQFVINVSRWEVGRLRDVSSIHHWMADLFPSVRGSTQQCLVMIFCLPETWLKCGEVAGVSG